MMEVFEIEQGGERFGRLTLLRRLPERTADNHVLGLWRCDCGNEKPVALSRVRNGYTRSCGCLIREVSSATNRKHGRRETREYSSWTAMKGRCLDPDNRDYPRWGGRGVTICPEWIASFEEFFAHIGPRPVGTTLDRIDNSRSYEPGNVRWATNKEQAANRRDTWIVEIHGTRYPSAEAAALAHGVSTTTIRRWCEGFVDPRRAHHANRGLTPARADCRMWRKYAA